MKALCVYVDGGKGHYVPAKAVMEALQEMNIDARLDEFFSYLKIEKIGIINKKYWRTMLKMPGLEKKLSKHNDADSNGMQFAVNMAKKYCTKTLLSRIEEFHPDFIFATHPYASTILSEMLCSASVDIPVYYFATDVFTAPVATICDKLRRFYISTEEGAERVLNMGQRPDSVVVSPFPLQKNVAEGMHLTKEEARTKIGLDPNLFTLQLNLGGEGIGSLSLLRGLLKEDKLMQIAVIGGMNKKMTKRINEIISHSHAENTKVYVPGFVSNVNEYLAASDIVAGRAGINTIVEAMYAHRPFLITELVYTVLPSAEYVVGHGVGWNASDNHEEALKIVLDAYEQPGILSVMEDNFNAIPIEYSADKLAAMIVADATSRI